MKDREREFERLKKAYLDVKAPETGLQEMKKGMERAKREKAEISRRKEMMKNNGKQTGSEKIIKMEHRKASGHSFGVWRSVGAAAAAALAILVVTPNISPAAAEMMGNLPVLGSIVRVVTIRDYQMDDGKHQANVAVPNVEVERSVGETADNQALEQLDKSAEQMNQSAKEYTDKLIQQFESDIAQWPDAPHALDIDYQIVTDTERWFTLRIEALEIQASGYQHAKYYNLDKESGKIVLLKDLFKTDADYRTALAENIRQQMKEQTAQDESKTFFPEEVTLEKEEQNFYLNQDGNLVIVFDEYDAAPGYMGMLEFVIPDDVTAGIRLK